MRSMPIPKRSHHTESLETPKKAPRLAKGTPLPAKLDDPRLEQLWRPVGLPRWPPGAIHHARQPRLLVAGEDLVAGLAGDIEFPAQIGHLFAFE